MTSLPFRTKAATSSAAPALPGRGDSFKMGTLGSLGFRCHQFTTIAPKTSISINAKLPVLRILGSAHFNMTNNTPLSDPLKGILMVVMEGKCCKLDERGGCLQCTTAAWRNDRLVGMRNDGTSTRLFRSSLTHLRIHGNRTIWTSIGSQRPSLLGSDSERSVAYEPIDHRKSPPTSSSTTNIDSELSVLPIGDHPVVRPRYSGPATVR